MKTRALFAATLIGIGALTAQSAAARPPNSAGADAALSGRAGDAGEHVLRGSKHRHPGHRIAAMGHGAGIARLDTDGDGRISRVELEQALPARAQRDGAGHHRGAAGRGLLEHFDAIDIDRDGHIVRAELRAWHHARRPQREAERERRYQARFDAADLNGDGRLSRIEVDESMPRLSARFAWMDEDGDGFLGPEELRPQRMR